MLQIELSSQNNLHGHIYYLDIDIMDSVIWPTDWLRQDKVPNFIDPNSALGSLSSWKTTIILQALAHISDLFVTQRLAQLMIVLATYGADTSASWRVFIEARRDWFVQVTVMNFLRMKEGWLLSCITGKTHKVQAYYSSTN